MSLSGDKVTDTFLSLGNRPGNHQDSNAINAWDQITLAGGTGFIIAPSHSLVGNFRNGWNVTRIVENREIKTDPNGPWYTNGRKQFGEDPRLPWREARKKALEDAIKWVEDTYGEKGPWARNRHGDYVAERINKEFPIKKE